MTNKIRILDDNTINKIAAGEVVERPSSIVKELIENSIDADSTSITIEIKEGGKSYIRVTDNGNGINPEDIQLAFLRHSTSKISNPEDLSRVLSLGFRGEALASISAVSMVELITKTEDNNIGKSVEIHGGVLKEELDVGAPKGTTIIVKNIFYNTPVRRKFLKSEGAESANIGDIINKLAMCNPNISFKYIKDGKNIIKTPGNGDIKSTIYSIYGKEYTKSLIKVSYVNDKFRIWGYISEPSLTRGNRSNELFFINKRYVSSLILSKAVEDAYSSLITINRFPIVFLYIDIDPEDVDVNVHPSKIEVRFENEMIVVDKIKSMIKKRLLGENLVPQVQLTKEKDQGTQENIIDIIDSSESNVDTSDNIVITNKEINHLNNQYKSELNKSPDIISENNYDVSSDYTIDDNMDDDIDSNYKGNDNNTQSRKNAFPTLNILGRIFETYVIAEDKKDNAMYMIDQHAAHERVMYEKLKNQYEREAVIIQPLLANENLNLNHHEFQLVSNNIDLFRKLGFDIEEFGHNTILLRGVPMVFGWPDNKKLFIDILDNLSNEINNRYELKAEKIIKMSCTNAIKAGDFLGSIEINQLIEDLKKCDNPFTCPHGRPITIKITKYEIEKMFKRIQ
ncbi:DNA mismatch repair endonuclease MutL [Clostridium sp. D2Q-11]|uniref:DNA mismatch repair protein MutL n=1 Tax=Anaeromonas frigoriresistens TaxID=2683708 RepID=A0A942V125_9FIRM|nr:DNA mismatch repair endonuclease MutL [Anaeromonas frigoriresistens]MBS4539926.1 DNA mismatch repair endonuclease MutL [Anaeromonas frigoriresistens]